MTAEKWKRVTLSSFILCGMLLCAFFSFRIHHRHHDAFSFTFFGLCLINSWLMYRYNLNRRQPDTLIHLFPTPSDIQGKT